jgi:ATP-binding cassette subfamily C (CFTR/MRP) protein 1
VERVLDFMTEPEHVNSTNYAYGLIGAYAIVYIGIAVCSFLKNTRALADNII